MQEVNRSWQSPKNTKARFELKKENMCNHLWTCWNLAANRLKDEEVLCVKSLHALYYTLHYWFLIEPCTGCLQEAVMVRETYRLLGSCSCSRWGAARGRWSVLARTFHYVWSFQILLVLGLVWSRLWNSTPLQQHHNNNQDWVGLCLAEQTRTGWTQRWPGEKKTRGVNGWGSENLQLSIQPDRSTQSSLYVRIFFWEDRDYDLVKYLSKDVLSCPVACH